jgi:hypothetical protein
MTAGSCMSVRLISKRRYQQLAEKKEGPRLNEFGRLFSGWLAILEVWSTSDTERHSLHSSIRIPLKTKEVQTQYLQSWWCDVTSIPDLYAWKVQFPIAIASNGTVFSILRTLYCLKPGSAQSLPSYDYVQLPVESHPSLQAIWSKYNIEGLHGTFNTKSSATTRLEVGGELYMYWLHISEDGTSIFYTDQRLGRPKNVAMFRLYNDKRTTVSFLGLQILTKYAGPGTEALGNLKVAFHPTADLVAFIFSQSVFLWVYRCECSPTELLLNADEPKDLEFSSCGRSIVIWTMSSKLPIVQPIPAEFSEVRGIVGFTPVHQPWKEALDVTSALASALVSSPYLDRSEEEPQTKSALQDSHQDRRKPTSEDSNDEMQLELIQEGTESVPGDFELRSLGKAKGRLYPHHMIQQNHTVTHDDGSSSGLAVSLSDGGLILRSWSTSGGVSDQNIELSKLPSWPGLSTSRPSIKLPQGRNKFVKFVLNRQAEVWCDMSDLGDEHLPAVVMRDAAMIKGVNRPDYSSLDACWLDASSIPWRIRSPRRPVQQGICPFDSGHHYRSLHGKWFSILVIFSELSHVRLTSVS